MSNTCDRCLKPCGNHWSDGWSCTGTIDVQAASQMFAKLCGAIIADTEHFAIWKEGHPAMTKNEAQHATFVWGPSANYRLCYDCHNELLSVVGKFFGFHRRAEQLKPASAVSESDE